MRKISAIIGAASVAAVCFVGTAQAWWGGGPWGGWPGYSGWGDDGLADGWGDFSMNMSGGGRGRGWNRYNNYYYGYGPYGWGGNPYGWGGYPYAVPPVAQ